MVAALGYSREDITAAVREMYTAVATSPGAGFHFPVGRAGCRAAGYPDALLEGVPEEALDAFAGVGCPFRADVLREGDRVLDIGAGAGVDTAIASRIVGPNGCVYALDTTPAMTERLRRTLTVHGIDNVEVIDGDAEAIPLPDASVDAVTSNGVLNLVPDKRRAMREMFRVLRPGGRIQLADIVIHRPVTPDCMDDPKLWAECVVGATVDQDYLDMFRDAGFDDVGVVRSADYFAHSPSPETREVAEGFGARAIELRMQRAELAPKRSTVLARRMDPRRVIRRVERRGLSGVIALGLALAACYGTMAAVALLALAGTTVAIHEGIWAGTIALLAIAAAAFVAAGLRKHGEVGPTIMAAAGAGVITYTMFLGYDPVVEAAGFVALAGGVAWDHWIRRYRPVHGRRRDTRPTMTTVGTSADQQRS